MSGGDGNDWLGGWNGNDVLLVGNGSDELYGMKGDDYLYGGSGDDKFVFADGGGQDTIYGFVTGAQSEDAINLSNHSEANGFGDIAAT